MNALHTILKTVGNADADAVAGLSSDFVNAATRFDWTAIGNFIQMGNAACTSDRADAVSTLWP